MSSKNESKNLLIENQDLASEWHPTKNGCLTPNNITIGSGKKVWWQCKKGHEWEAAVNNRAKGNGCPCCSGRRATSENNLQVLNPELAKQWHPTKNGDLMPSNVLASAGKKVWWMCEQCHEWEATINSRASGNGCPFCSGKRVCADNSLQTLNPELAKQWHPTKNGDLTPSNVTASAGKKVWWMCEQAHEWESTIAHRSDGTNCPFCSGRRVSSEKNLQVLNPDLAKQWHPTKNGVLTPSDVMVSSGKKAWWVCEHAHEWEATIASRSSGNGCPECNKEGKTSFPEQAIYFYLQNIFNDTLNRYKYDGKWEIDIFVPSLNFGIEYDGFYFHDENRTSDLEKEKYLTNKMVSLLRVKETRGEKKECYVNGNIVYLDGRFTKQLLNKTIGLCIDYISKNITRKFYDININIERDRSKIYELYIQNEKANSLFSQYPELSKEWHQNKNLSITPDMVAPGSLKRVWWQCKNGHEWEAAISTRAKGIGCPYCSGRNATSEKNLQKSNPVLAKQWHPTKNGELTPNNVKEGSGKSAWWLCEKGHEWKAVIGSRSIGNGCPYCSGKYASSENNLQVLNPDLAKEWHSTKNGNLTPREVTVRSAKKVWWMCGKGHEWESTIANRTSGNGCPYCSGKRAWEGNSLQTMNLGLAKQWHPIKNVELTPNDVTIGSGKIVWWICDKGHEWEAVISSRSRGNGCPYCSGQRTGADNSLQALNPDLAKQWHPTKNESLTPNDVTPGSNKKVWWQCDKGHEWEAVILRRRNGARCPLCNKM